MKTLVVLSALAAVALAAPTLLEEGSADFKKIITNVPATFKRERKSPPQEFSSDSGPSPVGQSPGGVNLPSTSQIAEFGVSGRSFGLKKPIIIKKKQGYHVYRDSDEEQAESSETCGKQVKVKLCDVKSEDMMKSSTVEDLNTLMTEEDMKHSIKLAKEAVENLQRDLKIVERQPGIKSTTWDHAHSESDAELHQDIEVAREALEHIHKNFGNLESMSLHTGTLKDAETINDADFTIANTEEQRLAQWKEAMNTIQKNFEIAKNIEDSFKAASGETGDMIVDSNKHETSKMTEHITAGDMVTKNEHKVDCKIEPAREKSSEKENTKSGLTEDDMTPSASTLSEKKIEDFHDSEKMRHASELPSDTLIDKALNPDKSLENALKEKHADIVISQDEFKKDSLVSDSMKTMEDTKEKQAESEPKDKNLPLEKSVDSVPAPTNEMKFVESEDMLLDQQRDAAPTHEPQSQKLLKHDEHFDKMESPEKKHEVKSAENFAEEHSNINKKEDKTQDEHLHTEQPKQVDTTIFMKSAEKVPDNADDSKFLEILDNIKTHEKHKDQITEGKMADHLKQQTEMINSAEQMQVHQHKQSLLHPEMRTADDFKNIHHHELVEPPQTRWAEDKDHHMQMESMKSADAIHSQTMNHAHTVQHSGHHHHVAHSMKNHHFDTPSVHGHLHSRFPDNFMAQGKSADLDMQSYYMSMRDGSGLGPDGHRFRWKPTHETSRTAYGAPAGPAAASPSNGGAVGLFPNANVGSCGIPLLLSCNPSVVSGSLSKAPTYSAPAYRTEDDFNFHTKRDVKKNHENLPSPMNRTPANDNLKTSTVLVAKQ